MAWANACDRCASQRATTSLELYERPLYQNRYAQLKIREIHLCRNCMEFVVSCIVNELKEADK